MSRSEPQVNFRMPAELKARLELAAAENKRSVTAEFVARLTESFQAQPSADVEALRRELALMHKVNVAEGLTRELTTAYLAEICRLIPADIKAQVPMIQRAERYANAWLNRTPDLPEAFAEFAKLIGAPGVQETIDELAEEIRRNPPKPRRSR